MGLSFSSRKFVQGTISVTDHGGLTGLGDDDHDIYAKADGSREWGISGSFAAHGTATSGVHGAGTGNILTSLGTINGSVTTMMMYSDTADNWSTNNPTLGTGVVGFEHDTGFTKIGNGTSMWTELTYITSGDTGLGAVPYGRNLQGAAWDTAMSDGTIYYFGGLYAHTATTQKGRSPMPVLTDSILKRASVVFYQPGTGSAEEGTVCVQVNGTSDYIISGSAKWNQKTTKATNYEMAIPCWAGDNIEFKIITPAWATNPGTIMCNGYLSFDDVAPGGLGTIRPPGTIYVPGTGSPGTEDGEPGTPDPPPGSSSIYGTAAYNGGEPIGGGAGYSGVVTSGDYTAYTLTQLKSYISSAGSGDVIYIPGTCNFTADGTITVDTDGITIASNRGQGSGSPGATINIASSSNRVFNVTGQHVTIKGLIVKGRDADGETTAPAASRGIAGDHGMIVENCEIYNFGDSGVAIYVDYVATSTGIALFQGTSYPHGISKIRFCHIYRCRKSGNGYCVGIGESTTLIECNIFDYYRHAISGARNEDSGQSALENVFCDCRYNRFTANGGANGPASFDQHGGSDGPSMSWNSGPQAWSKAGGRIDIHHNKFESKAFASVQIRGVPSYHVNVYRNWTYWSSSSSTTAFKQLVSSLGLSGYQKMTVSENWYGTSAPPSS